LTLLLLFSSFAPEFWAVTTSPRKPVHLSNLHNRDEMSCGLVWVRASVTSQT